MPRIVSPVASRPVYYDRNPSSQTLIYVNAGTSPHSVTERDARTIPAGSKGFVEIAQTEVRRSSAASSAGVAQMTLGFTPDGGSLANLFYAALQDDQNSVGDAQSQVVSATMILEEGDKIAIRTADGSTGGSVDYTGTAKIMEFDA